jgi:hydroxyacylglutathione hydrolase
MTDPTVIVETFVLGALENNSYLVWDQVSKEGVVIDPSFDPSPMNARIEDLKLSLRAILLTHAHFDHIAGVNDIFEETSPRPQIMINKLELPLWQRKGAAEQFGFQLPALPEPDLLIQDGDLVQIGNYSLKAIFTPGHTPGHMVYYLKEIATVFTGDLIFFRGVGRTDMFGGNSGELFKSIDEKILTLLPETILLSGHGPATTVRDEKQHNPFL